MERTKRQLDDTIDDYNNNKKQKLQNENNFLVTIINSNKSVFEDLANETIYEIFDYLDVYHVYEGFFYLNKRFKNLLVNSNLPIQINISTMSISNFELYHKNMIQPNKHRINYLRLSNPFTVNIIFSPPITICEFFQLETLILDDIYTTYLNNILRHLFVLSKLHSLTLILADFIEDPSPIFVRVFRLRYLKSFKFTYQTKNDERPSPIYMTEHKHSPIEYLIINSRFRFDSLRNLFFCLPKLRYLEIDCLVGSYYIDITPCSIILKYLKYVSIKLDSVHFNSLKKLIIYFFRYVEILRISKEYDPTYLHAKQWEELILSFMPNLRIFDINHFGLIQDNYLMYHDLINQFDSSFWIDKQWFFTHQHYWRQNLDNVIFYSTNPYRRKDYKFYWELDQQNCPHIQENNLNSVKHVHIGSKQATNKCINYFPNVTELTIEHYFQTFDDLISTTLNRIVPFKQLIKLVILCDNFPFEQIIQLICCTPNLHTFKLNALFPDKTNSSLIQQSEIFQYVSNTNKIKNFELHEYCTLENFQLIIDLFPHLEYLKTGMNRKQINQIIRFLLSKTNNKIRRLFFLCISQIPKMRFRELKMLIKFENLLNHYFIKRVNHDLYLWW